ncbi:rhodanese-like domain-containing protein [Flammeovirgaceae bacterium SG7u.111]|nr:rhodanese-like domain-containing protein [Flammeovirgaceae bacterium SG7u.132]WPO38622.1 rhodanese-like domain-containing protein [Flammeovirgaceae bacterium SG7u.111]
MNLEQSIASGKATIVDVRSEMEYQMGHCEDSINIPLHELPERIDEFKTMAKPLVLCCASGNRSGQATGFLQQQGVDDVHNGGPWQEVQYVKSGEVQ